MEESQELTFNVTFECMGSCNDMTHLALYIHDWLKISANAEDYKDSRIVVNHGQEGCVSVVVWPHECRQIPPAWLMDYRQWCHFCRNVISNYHATIKEDI